MMVFSWEEEKDIKNFADHRQSKNILFVAYEERDEDEIHLISARPATARERRIYNGDNNDDIEPWGPAY